MTHCPSYCIGECQEYKEATLPWDDEEFTKAFWAAVNAPYLCESVKATSKLIQIVIGRVDSQGAP